MLERQAVFIGFILIGKNGAGKWDGVESIPTTEGADRLCGFSSLIMAKDEARQVFVDQENGRNVRDRAEIRIRWPHIGSGTLEPPHDQSIACPGR